MSLHDDIIDFLNDRNWIEDTSTKYFIYFNSPEEMEDEISIRIPINDLYSDYTIYMNGVLEVLKNLYPKSFNHPQSRIKYFMKKLGHLERKYSKNKDEWIMPEIESRISNISIDTIYVPNK